jgi:hypothetical protein
MNIDSTGDKLIKLLGLGADDILVQTSLDQLARGMQPELDPENEEVLIDWVTVNEIGLEYGFQDEAYFRAWNPDMRRKVRLILTQLYFYGDTSKTRPFPFSLPFGLTFTDDRASVRRKLVAFDNKRRSYIRDAWSLPNFDITIAYGGETNLLESIYCHLPCKPWPIDPEETKLVSPLTPEILASLLGLRWSSSILRTKLAPLGYDKELLGIRSEHVADFLLAHGLELMFASVSQIPTADQRYSRSLALAGVTYYSNRELDAREWVGPLPFDIEFTDNQATLPIKVGHQSDLITDEDRYGVAVWHFSQFSLTVVYSNIENRILRITMLAPGFWEISHRKDDP